MAVARKIEYEPLIDFTEVPDELEGMWIVVSMETHQIMGSGPTPQDAMESTNVGPDNLTIVLARVPVEGFALVL